MKTKKTCLCGYNGRSDHVFTHEKRCVPRNKIQKLLKEIEYLKRIILSSGLNADLTNFCDLDEQVTTKQYESNDDKSTKGYNYIIREREFIRMNEEVYKVGKCEDMSKRFKQYPKGSELVKYATVKDRHMSESLMIDDFKKHFIHRKDLGTEYFEGDISLILCKFHENIAKEM